MTVHNGKLYVGTSIGEPGRAAIFASSDPVNEGWTKVADFAGTTNTEVIALKSFNGCLYVTTQGNVDLADGIWHGFEVWRSMVPDPANPDVIAGGDWKQIVTEGAGDSRNFWGASMEALGDYIYIGTISLPVSEYFAQTFKGFELIRVGKDDKWELVIGNHPQFVGMSNSTTAERGIPISGLPAGFGNPLNFYCWSLQEHDGILYLGTLDISSFILGLPAEVLAGTFDLPESIIARMREMITGFAGADLWKTADGIAWEPVSLDGFGNPHNYGFRTMFSGSLYVGTANPYVGQGCEIWAALPEQGPGVAWHCPLGGVALIAPNLDGTRPPLTGPIACADVVVSAGAELWGIYHLVEEPGPQQGTWLWYVPGFATSTLAQLEPGKMYFVVASEPCTLTLRQA
jgi:hypothetical protein